MSTITLTVTAEDILVDRRSNGSRCAIARAAKRVIPQRFAWVTERELYLDATERDKDGYPISGTTDITFPAHVLDWHRAFMGGRPVEPITFSLDIPDAPEPDAVP